MCAKPKGYGRNARIEGTMTEASASCWSRTHTDGGSKLEGFVDAIRETGANCNHGGHLLLRHLPETTQRLADHGVALHHLCTWWDVLAEAKAQSFYDAATCLRSKAS